ncbi:MAG: hypothetical protein KGJ55_05540 [Gammaproteobacteria bacterium]|nr:hypothetical protein [Gammaproteobacteria bacterium]
MKTLRDPKRRPTHPGAVLREDVLPALDMTRRTAADVFARICARGADYSDWKK